MKTCQKCGVEQSESEFAKNRNTCKECKRKANKQWYLENTEYKKSKTKIRNKQHYSEVGNWFKKYKETLSCKVCGESCSACLDFHHLKDKDFSLGDQATRRRMSIARIEREIAKCIVLCANCHRKVHAGILSVETPTPGT